MTRRKLRHELVVGRRQLLRGAIGGMAVAFGLPALEAMFDENGARLASGAEIPRRLLAFHWGNGVNLDFWVPGTTGPDFELTDALAPLANVREHCRVLTNFRNYVAGRRGHHDGMAGLYSCYPFIQLEAQGAPYASKFGGISFDQVVADIIGNDTFHRSLQVGVTKRHLQNQGPTLLSMSHRGPDQPLSHERDPQALFDKLFLSFSPEDDPHAELRARAVDAVSEDAKRLRSRVGAADRQRLDAHLESLFQLQKQILAIPPTCEVPDKPTVEPYLEDGAEPLYELNAAMAQLVGMAFQCDLTRVITYMFTGPSGGTQFHMLTPDKFPEFPDAHDLSHADHHETSHYNQPYQHMYMHRSAVVAMENLAYILELLAAIPEGDGSMLDHSCVLAASDVAEGWAHSEVDFPLIVAGGAGGRLKSDVGHYRSPDEEPIHNVSLACAKSVLPEPDAITELGGEQGNYSGYTNTPCAAIYAG